MTEAPKQDSTPTAPDRDQRGDRAALLIIDMINPFDFAGGDAARRAAEPVAATIARLRAEADAREVPTIYVNDNFGEWHSDRDRLVAAARPALAGGAIEPRARDFFVIKPQFSGFYSTNLAVLLPKLGVRRLILTGIATEICILVTASDAHMRDYTLWVPENGVVPLDRAHGAAALAIMGMRMDARTERFEDGALAGWMTAADKNARF